MIRRPAWCRDNMSGVSRRSAIALVFAGLVAVLLPTSSHADDVFMYLGTISSVDAQRTRLTITWVEQGRPHSADVALGQATSFTRGGTGVSIAHVKAGEKAFVIAQFNEFLDLDVPEATDVILGQTEWPKNFP